jgi:hypothetical protein
MALGGWKARERARTEDVVCSHATHSALRRLRSRPNGPLDRPGLPSDVPTFKERRQAYNGRVEVWVNVTKRLDALARLVGYVDVSATPILVDFHGFSASVAENLAPVFTSIVGAEKWSESLMSVFVSPSGAENVGRVNAGRALPQSVTARR